MNEWGGVPDYICLPGGISIDSDDESVIDSFDSNCNSTLHFAQSNDSSIEVKSNTSFDSNISLNILELQNKMNEIKIEYDDDSFYFSNHTATTAGD